MRNGTTLLSVLLLTLASTAAVAQYTPSAGQNAPASAYMMEREADGQVRLERAPEATVQRDGHGNASGNQYDLAVDGAFEGQTVLILDQVGNTLVNTRAALREKGLASVVYPAGLTPSVDELRGALAKSCQVWLISTGRPLLEEGHIAAIQEFFQRGHGVYIWGDNHPLYVDANRVANALIPGLGMRGNLYGDRVVGISRQGSSGVREGHLITTGLEHLYEGVTIATLQFNGEASTDSENPRLYNQAPLDQHAAAWKVRLPPGFTPLLFGSSGNLVSTAYEQDGKRLVVDGGFTRLAVNWDDAGTARYVKNAAAWLVNAERFGDKVATRR